MVQTLSYILQTSTLQQLCSPRNPHVTVVVYCVFTQHMNKMLPSKLQVCLMHKYFHGFIFFFFFFSPYLRILTLGNLFSGLRPLKLFLTCSTYFWNDIHIFALFSLFLEPRIIPLDTTFGPFLGGLGGSTMKGCWGFPRWRQEAQDSASHMCVCVCTSL